MKKMFNKNQRIGEIATIFPKATDIFMDYEIDFCCGGDRELEAALKEQGISSEEMLYKLNKAYDEFKDSFDNEVDWKTRSMTELIDYVVNKHHSFMREELPITAQLLNKILKVHYIDSGGLLSKLNKLFSNLKMEIEEHLIKEEELLFPLIKEYEKNPSDKELAKVLKVMSEIENEHENAGDILKEMRRITKGYIVPETGCSSFERTYQKMQEIEADLFKHIHLENNILFERLKKQQ
jgi:regulator of cell morphogenesis and NO signaling